MSCLVHGIRTEVGWGDVVRLLEAHGGEMPPGLIKVMGLVHLADGDAQRRSLGAGPEMDFRAIRDAIASRFHVPVPLPVPQVQEGRRFLRFPQVLKAEPLATPQQRRPVGNPLPLSELDIPDGAMAPPTPALMPWGRMAGGLRQRLGATVNTRRVDARAVDRMVGRGLPLVELPRVRRVLWASNLVLLWDHSTEMDPFRQDMLMIRDRLHADRGRGGLVLRLVKGSPDEIDVRAFPVDAPVLALSAMGQLRRARGIEEAWARLGQQLRARGHVLMALSPAPRDRWNRDVIREWPTAIWDRTGAIPRSGSLGRPISTVAEEGPSERDARRKSLANEILDLLSPAARVEPSLLRTVRLRHGPEADAAVEHDAWFGLGTWMAWDCFGFREGPLQGERLARRATHADARDVGNLVVEHHRHHSLAIQFETRLRASLHGGDFASEVGELMGLLSRIVDRLRLLAAEPGGNEGIESGLPWWFLAMARRLTREIRSHPMLQSLLSEGWAAAIVFGDTGAPCGRDGSQDLQVPEGLDGDRINQMMRELVGRCASIGHRVFRQGDAWCMAPAPAGWECEGGGLTLGRIQVDGRRVSVFRRDDSGEEWGDVSATWNTSDLRWGSDVGQRKVHLLGTGGGKVELFRSRGPIRVEMETAQERLVFGSIERPHWARSVAQDRYGLRATFAVRGVTFALRWIPPGSFWMGSPEDEPGRLTREGPRHRVTIRHGFWMGETPVTQEQWRAVAEEAGPAWGLNPSPSYFKPRADLPPSEPYSAQGGLPVERVSWDDCLKFTQFLSSLSGQPNADGLSFRLPTEAEWEHACRAGTDTALYTGAIDLDGTSAKALDDIAWYVHNSGPDVDVEDPWNAKVLLIEDQVPFDRAGMHRVGMKRPNAWGLHDMLGNVWEWCCDDRRDYQDANEVNPTGLTGEGVASRVVRGGSWSGVAMWCRSAFRLDLHRDARGCDRGLRLLAGHQLGLE